MALRQNCQVRWCNPLDTRTLYLKEYTVIKNNSDEKEVFHAVMPPCVVVAGHTSQLADKARRESFELFRNNLRECCIITFDELFRKTECLVDLLESSQIPPQEVPF